ncbi:MAG TPA: hypothetical protein VJ715_13280 [Pyrinomonadaceae bacterium]|nr:hypothetical protein [Pyrinomonadaceae bacterium]
MQKNRPVRIVKRDQRARAEQTPQATTAEGGAVKSTERDMKAVVAGWVREHRQQAEQYRRAVAGLLRDSGLRPSIA